MPGAADHPLRQRMGRLAAVTVVSVIVWLWAARATTEQDTVESVISIELPSAEARQERELISPSAPFTVHLALSGPRGDLERADKRLRQVNLITGADGVPEGIANHTIDVRGVLQGLLDDSGIDVTIKRVEGDVPSIDVDDIESAVVPIKVVLGSGGQLEGEPIVRPETAVVRLPRSLRDRAGTLRIDAQIDEALLQTHEGGRQYVERVPLKLVTANKLDPTARVRLSPESAVVTYTLAARTATTVIGAGADPTTAPGVPVQVALPTKDLDRFTITLDDRDAFLRNVVLAGSAAQIDQIAQGKFKVIAFVQLTSDDLDRAALDNGRIVKPITLWQLPAGVSVVNPGKTDSQALAEREGERSRGDGVAITVKRRTG
ncbi:MAG: hypothetical protein U0575_08225 [Phycisphaerales bacterium]